MATQKLQVYKCQVCGIVTEILDGGAGEPVCCGVPMTLQQARTADPAGEKHVPVLEWTAQGLKVTVGSTPHPMEAQHFIQWIEVIAGERTFKQFLAPGQAPEALFPVTDGDVTVREFCNKHGLWQA